MATKSRRTTGGTSEGEFRSGPMAGTALLDGETFRRKPVVYSEVDGLALVEGDIVLGPIAEVQRAADDGRVLESVGITGAQFRWPDATVPFTIEGGLTNQARVTDAIAHWESRTRIRLVPRDPSLHPHWVNFRSGGGCSSPVGMRGVGEQNITLGTGCTTGNTIHEIGHALGLWHEQSREDRDTFVQIVFANIDPSMTHNFTQHISDGDDLGTYDYGSLMHYPPTAFSTNGQATIIALQPIPPGVVMGQRDGLSAGDIAGVHAMYPGGAITVKELTKEPVIDAGTTVKEVLKEAASDPVVTRKELSKDPVDDPVVTRKELVKEPTNDPVVTRKELVKEPTNDLPTRKELPKDPILEPLGPVPGRFGPFESAGAAASTFVTGAPSRAPTAATPDTVQLLIEQVEQLGQALAVVEQQRAALAAAYDAAVAALAQAQGQG